MNRIHTKQKVKKTAGALLLCLALPGLIPTGCAGDHKNSAAPPANPEELFSTMNKPAITLPPGITTEDARQTALDFFRYYRSRYLKVLPGTEPPQAYIDWLAGQRTDPQVTWVDKRALTVSEAQGYGMLAVVQAARLDPGYLRQGQEDFNALVHYAMAHPSPIDPRLMCWRQFGRGYQTDGSGTLTGAYNDPQGSSATDGDLDIAYALLLAHATWGSSDAAGGAVVDFGTDNPGSSGTVAGSGDAGGGTTDFPTDSSGSTGGSESLNYLGLARERITAIAESNLDPESGLILLGDWVNEGSGITARTTRSSDFLFGHLVAFKAALPTLATTWDAAYATSLKAVLEITENYSSPTGLIPDFIVQNSADDFQPAPGRVLESSHDGDFNWNACRTPWRLAAHLLTTGSSDLAKPLTQFSQWIHAATEGSVQNIAPGYFIQSGPLGEPIPGRDYSDLSFTAPVLAAAAAVNSLDPAASDSSAPVIPGDWYRALWDYHAKPSEWGSYFGESIQMQVLFLLAGGV